MKTNLRIGLFIFAMLLVVAQPASADQVTYSLNEEGGSGNISGGGEFFLNETVHADLGTYQFSGSVNPSRTGLIGVSSGFRAAVSRFVPGFTPDVGGGPLGGPQAPDSNTGGGGPGDFPSTEWTRITIDTRAIGEFQTLAEINGLSSFNDVGYVRFDWVVTGISNLFLTGGDLGQISVHDALSVAALREGSGSTPTETFVHSPARGPNGALNDLSAANLQAESFLVPFDTNQLAPGEIPRINVDFELVVETRLDVTNVDDLGNFEALFDADFSNTATLFNVSVLDSNQNPISGASVIDAATGQSLVASSIPEPSATLLLILAGVVGSIRRRRCEL